jgi:hypothetical protein
MTALLPLPIESAEATPDCGCCIPPPDATDKDRALAELQARREAVERRLGALPASG